MSITTTRTYIKPIALLLFSLAIQTITLLESAQATVIVTGTTKGVKFHPGHYIAPAGGDKSVDGFMMKQAYTEINSTPALVGIQLHLKWAEVELSKGVINEKLITDHLNKLSANNGKKRVILFLNTKTSNLNEKLLPDYLTNTAHPDYDPDYKGGVYPWGNEVAGTNASVHKGNAAKLWIPKIRDRLAAVMQKLGQKYNAHSHFEGVGLNETAMGQPLITVTAAEVNAHYASLLYVQNKMKTYFPNTMTFQLTNYSRAMLPEFIMGSTNSLKSMGTALGGPDVWLNDDGVDFAGTQYSPPGVYTYYPKLSGIVPLTPSVMSGNYVCSRADCNESKGNFIPTVRQLLNYSRDKLKANYIFWTRTIINGSDSKYKEVYNMLKNLYASSKPEDRAAVKLDTRCPSMYAPCIID